MKITTKKVVEVSDWDSLVEETYGRRYSFQQQNGCQDRGIYKLVVPTEKAHDCERETIKEKVNGPEEGVSFAAWLARDPKQKLDGQTYDYQLSLWWERNFYPSIEMVANDLHAKGLIEAGEYIINIDW